MNIKITKSSVQRAKPKLKPYELRDTKLVGLIVRVQPTGRKIFYCQYQRGSRVKLGIFPALSIKDAYTKALKVFSDFHSGKDPRKPKRECHRTTKFGVFLQEQYFPWVDANHKNPKDTKQRLIGECGAFSSFHFTEITPYAVDKWRLAKIARGNSPHTANKCFAYLRAALAKADEWEIHSPNPVAKMKKIRTEKPGRVRYLSVQEESRLRACLSAREETERCSNQNLFPFNGHLLPMVLISINTGVRQGELFSLKWRNVDFGLKQISISAGNAKSRKVRHVPLNDEALITFQLIHNSELSPDVLVFRRSDNEPFKCIRKSWANLLTASDIENFRWHDLRHHFASKLAMAGVDLNTVRELLGHSSYEMTLRYAHLSHGHKADAVARLNP